MTRRNGTAAARYLPMAQRTTSRMKQMIAAENPLAVSSSCQYTSPYQI
jgi:hypothetical protein